MQARVEQLKTLNAQLTALLTDPQPGLLSWLLAVDRCIRAMATVTGALKQ